MENLDKIKTFISESEQGTIFTTPEWLEAVAPGKWDYITNESAGSIKACMPIILNEKLGLTICNMPPFTQSLGIMYPAYEGKYAEVLTRKMNALSEIIPVIPKNSYFRQRLHTSITNWLPFYWQEYNQLTRYTYIIKDLANQDKIWKSFRSNIRQEIRKASKTIKIFQEDDFESLSFCIDSTFARQRNKNFDFSTLKNIFDSCKKLKNGKIFLAKNENGICGAIYLVWDKKSAYYIAGGSPINVRTTGAMPLLLWEAIKFSSKVTKHFNFEGSMIKPIERFFRAFGGEQVPYFEITKINSKIISFAKNFKI